MIVNPYKFWLVPSVNSFHGNTSHGLGAENEFHLIILRLNESSLARDPKIRRNDQSFTSSVALTSLNCILNIQL